MTTLSQPQPQPLPQPQSPPAMSAAPTFVSRKSALSFMARQPPSAAANNVSPSSNKQHTSTNTSASNHNSPPSGGSAGSSPPRAVAALKSGGGAGGQPSPPMSQNCAPSLSFVHTSSSPAKVVFDQVFFFSPCPVFLKTNKRANKTPLPPFAAVVTAHSRLSRRTTPLTPTMLVFDNMDSHEANNSNSSSSNNKTRTSYMFPVTAATPSSPSPLSSKRYVQQQQQQNAQLFSSFQLRPNLRAPGQPRPRTKKSVTFAEPIEDVYVLPPLVREADQRPVRIVTFGATFTSADEDANVDIESLDDNDHQDSMVLDKSPYLAPEPEPPALVEPEVLAQPKDIESPEPAQVAVAEHEQVPVIEHEQTQIAEPGAATEPEQVAAESKSPVNEALSPPAAEPTIAATPMQGQEATNFDFGAMYLHDCSPSSSDMDYFVDGSDACMSSPERLQSLASDILIHPDAEPQTDVRKRHFSFFYYLCSLNSLRSSHVRTLSIFTPV